MNIFFHQKNKMIWFFLYIAVMVFLVICLVSYNPTDKSWFYGSSEPMHILNSAGFLGAELAALLYYMFGGASFLLLIPLVCSGFIFVTGRTIKTDGERLIAAIALVGIASLFFTDYSIDFAWSPYPGGIFGLWGLEKLIYYFDSVGKTFFLYISLCASLILLFRWSFMFLMQKIIGIITAVFVMMQKYRIVQRIIYLIVYCMRVVFIRLPLCSAYFIRSLISGTAFEDIDLFYPEQVYEYEESDNELNVCVSDRTLSLQKSMFLVFSFIQPLMQKKKLRCLYSIISLPKAKNKKPIVCARVVPKKQVINKEEFSSATLVSRIKKISQYVLPPMDIFVAEKRNDGGNDIETELQDRAQILQDKLKRFGVNGRVVGIKRGPVVTLFEYQPDIDTKLSKIIALEDDLAMALQAMSIRIIAPIPGKSVVGFEVSNTKRHDVLFSQLINQDAYTKFSGRLPLVLGKGTIGEAVVVDLACMPHLLIAGSTGSGKSVALNAILMSLLCKLNPDNLKLILIDPKRLEFATFTDIAHLVFPIITNPQQAIFALKWVVHEMEDRYEKMAKYGARNIDDYNIRILPHIAKDTSTHDERGEILSHSISSGDSSSAGTECRDSNVLKEIHQTLPFIVVVIDELADLMITAGRDIEDLITRITQMARAAGIHMIVATQRPSVDVITGLIKANFPSRISFKVASRIDSRTILDTVGADRLLGRGDMLFLDAATSQLRRVHGAYVSDKEIVDTVDHIRSQKKVEYLDVQHTSSMSGQDTFTTEDILYKDIRQFLEDVEDISISLLQRKFRIGYNRSARIIDLLEAQGLIMPQDGRSKTRKVIR